jgi:hypothetical protein
LIYLSEHGKLKQQLEDDKNLEKMKRIEIKNILREILDDEKSVRKLDKEKEDLLVKKGDKESVKNSELVKFLFLIFKEIQRRDRKQHRKRRSNKKKFK